MVLVSKIDIGQAQFNTYTSTTPSAHARPSLTKDPTSPRACPAREGYDLVSNQQTPRVPAILIDWCHRMARSVNGRPGPVLSAPAWLALRASLLSLVSQSARNDASSREETAHGAQPTDAGRTSPYSQQPPTFG